MTCEDQANIHRDAMAVVKNQASPQPRYHSLVLSQRTRQRLLLSINIINRWKLGWIILAIVIGVPLRKKSRW